MTIISEVDGELLWWMRSTGAWFPAYEVPWNQSKSSSAVAKSVTASLSSQPVVVPEVTDFVF